MCTSAQAQVTGLFTIPTKVDVPNTRDSFQLYVTNARSAIEKDIIDLINGAELTQIWGADVLKGVFQDRSLKSQFRSIVENYPTDMTIVLVDHEHGSDHSAERRMLYWDEDTLTYRFSYHQDNTIFMTKTAFEELSTSDQGKKFLKHLFSFKHYQMRGSYFGPSCNVEMLENFTKAYLRWQLFPKDIRQQIHIIRSRLSDIQRMTVLGSRLKAIVDRIRNAQETKNDARSALAQEALIDTLEVLEREFARFRIPEKRAADQEIRSVIDDLNAGKNERLLSRLGRGGALSDINTCINNLLEDVKKRKEQLPTAYYRTLQGIEINDPLTPLDERTVVAAYKQWVRGVQPQDIEPSDLIFKVYELCYKQDPRQVPSLQFVRDVLRQSVLNIFYDLMIKADSKVDDLNYYERSKVVREVINRFYRPGHSEPSKKKAALLRTFAMTPRFQWREKVPLEAREYISFMAAAGCFTRDIFEAKGVIEVDYVGEGTSKDWFLDVKKTDLAKNELGRPTYWIPGNEREFVQQVAHYSGLKQVEIRKQYNLDADKKSDRENGRKRLIASYHSYKLAEALREHIWSRDFQVYSLSWQDEKGQRHEEQWAIMKDPLLGQPIAFMREEPIENVMHIKDIAKEALKEIKRTDKEGPSVQQMTIQFGEPAETILKSA
ncbi:MAG: hypothetical protein JW938_04630 [Candidatus Omnitrophica bacterium]|nr:hypothetical protein [Candidatus Omnitrophota bacterium]